MKNKTSAGKLLLRENPPASERIIGIVCACIGAVLASFTWTLVRGPFFSKPSASIFVLLFIAACLTAMFLFSGIRLMLGKRNRFGSLFAPWVWFTISGTMLGATAVLAVMSAKAPSFAAAKGIASALFIALLAYGAGSHFKGKGRQGSGAA